MHSLRDRAISAPPAIPEQRLALVTRATLKEQSYLGLRKALISGRFEPGEQVTIKYLAEQLGAGVMPVREAVQRLVAEGALATLATGRVRVPRLSRDEFEEIAELRLLLEPLAAAKAAARCDSKLISRLAKFQREMDKAVDAGDTEAVLWANYSFHFALYAESGSRVLEEHIESLWLRAGPMIVHLLSDLGRRAKLKSDVVALQDEVLTPLRLGDAQGASRSVARIISAAAEQYRHSFPFAE